MEYEEENANLTRNKSKQSINDSTLNAEMINFNKLDHLVEGESKRRCLELMAEARRRSWLLRSSSALETRQDSTSTCETPTSRRKLKSRLNLSRH